MGVTHNRRQLDAIFVVIPCEVWRWTIGHDLKVVPEDPSKQRIAASQQLIAAKIIGPVGTTTAANLFNKIVGRCGQVLSRQWIKTFHVFDCISIQALGGNNVARERLRHSMDL